MNSSSTLLTIQAKTAFSGSFSIKFLRKSDGLFNSNFVVYTQNSSDAFRRLWRRGFGQKFRTEILNFDNFKFFFGSKFFFLVS